MLKGALIGFAIALAMLLPPIIHFISGPLGPLVGGFFGGSKAQVRGGQALIMGLLMGLFMVFPLAVLLVVGSVAEALLPNGVGSVLAVVAVVIVVYTGLMGSLGAAIGGHLALRQEAKKPAGEGSS